MIYIRIKLLSCVYLVALLSLAYAKPASDLRQKLERLFRDPEYNDDENEIHRPRQIQGMLLSDLREHDLFESSYEERFKANLNKLEKSAEATIFSDENHTSSTTTTTTTSTSTPSTVGSTATAITTTNTTSRQRSPLIRGGIERLSSIVSRLIDMWRRS